MMGIERFVEKVWGPSPEEIAQEKAWCRGEIERIGEERLTVLIETAVEARKKGYSPYFGYLVGASILCKSGRIFTGCNVEIVTATETEHAERLAINKAVSEEEIEESGEGFIEVVVVCHPGASGPCGGCRQKIAQHCDNALIIDVDEKGNIQKIVSLNILFPYSFGPHHLEAQ